MATTTTRPGGWAASLLFAGALLTSAPIWWQFAIPIFNGGRLRGNEQLAQAQYQELEAQYQGAALTAFQDVETALAGLARLRGPLRRRRGMCRARATPIVPPPKVGSRSADGRVAKPRPAVRSCSVAPPTRPTSA